MGKARQNAQRHRAGFIEYNHVLRALLDVAECDAAKFLGDLGLEADWERLLEEHFGTE